MSNPEKQETLLAAFDYATALMEVRSSDSGIVETSSLENFDSALGNLVRTCVQQAQKENLGGDKALKWVPVARTALRKCSRIFPEFGGLEKTRILSEKNKTEQRKLYKDIKLAA